MKQETQQQTASTTTSQKVVSQQAQKSSASAIDKLKEFGGFAFLENIIDGYSNLNPARKARRNIFLTDEQWENERKALVNRLSVWLKLLRENDTAEQMRDKAKETAENAENLLNHNLKNALARTRELESAYRTIAFFYKNTESDKVKNVTIVNATRPWSSSRIWTIPFSLTTLATNSNRILTVLTCVATTPCLSFLDI